MIIETATIFERFLYAVELESLLSLWTRVDSDIWGWRSNWTDEGASTGIYHTNSNNAALEVAISIKN